MRVATGQAVATVAMILAVLAAATGARGDGPAPIRIGVLSQTEGTGHASATESITARRSRPPEPAHHNAVDLSSRVPAKGAATSAPVSAPPYPTLSASSTLAKNPTPFGPGTFWYKGGPGFSCVYAPGTSPLCYRLTSPSRASAPAIDPTVVAATVAGRLDLSPGSIETSPSSEGITGAVSWFWLYPAPTAEQATITLAGETVTVTATPTIDWAFGDGATLANAGAGTRYTPGAPPASAVVHTYQTRCVPGDQGRDPNVLPSCERNGYQVVATVTWQFAYRASGPISAAGTVPSRATEADRSYAVSEARAFLVGATP